MLLYKLLGGGVSIAMKQQIPAITISMCTGLINPSHCWHFTSELQYVLSILCLLPLLLFSFPVEEFLDSLPNVVSFKHPVSLSYSATTKIFYLQC